MLLLTMVSSYKFVYCPEQQQFVLKSEESLIFQMIFQLLARLAQQKAVTNWVNFLSDQPWFQNFAKTTHRMVTQKLNQFQKLARDQQTQNQAPKNSVRKNPDNTSRPKTTK